MIDRKAFFDAIRPKLFPHGLSQGQVDGIGKILGEWEIRGLSDVRWLAYMLATVFHETAEKMQPIPEGGSESYLQGQAYYPWIGRGLVQLTWQENYRKFGVTNPADALTWPVALRVMFEGMQRGMFAKDSAGPHSLARYFGSTFADPVNARRIINGKDKAETIAEYYAEFLAAIKAVTAAQQLSRLATAITPPATGPSIVTKPAPAKGFWARFWATLTGKQAA